MALWGCGPVGQLAVRCCFLLGAERVIAIDRISERLAMARASGAETINYEEEDVSDMLMQMTGGRLMTPGNQFLRHQLAGRAIGADGEYFHICSGPAGVGQRTARTPLGRRRH